MNFKEVITNGGGLFLIFITLIQIIPIKINPWSWIAKSIGNALNNDIIRKVDKLSDDVQNLKNNFDVREATTCRTRILRFSDEILHNVNHSKEHFDQILIDIDNYNNYCNEHPDFKNHIAVKAIDRIEKLYEKCMDDNTFLK